MQLLPNEEAIVSSESGRILLTNKRIQKKDKEWGQSYQIIIFLEDISSIERLYRSNFLYMVLGVIGLLVGLLTINVRDGEGVGYVGFAAAFIFGLLWLNSRKHTVTISSKGGAKLNFLVEGMGEAEVGNFLDDVCQAKAKRVSELIQQSS